MKRRIALALMALLAATPAAAKKLNPTNYPDPSNTVCEMLSYDAGSSSKKLAFVGDGSTGPICVETTGIVSLSNDLRLDDGVLRLTEQAAADADVATEGQLWVKTATPNTLWFTDDAGTDTQLGLGGAETNDLESVATSAGDAEIFVGTGADAGAYITGLAACAADEKIEYVPGSPDTFTCEAIGSLATSDLTSGTLAHERGGLEADISAVAIGDVIAGSGAGSVALVTASGHSDGDVLTLQADGSADWEAASAAQDVAVLDVVTADTEVVNTAAETTLWSDSVTLNDTDGIIHVRLRGTYLNNSGGNRSLTVRVKLGATTLWGDVSASLNASANEQPWDLDFIIQNRASTSSQIVTGRMHQGGGQGAGSVAGQGQLTTTHRALTGNFYGTATEDWTGALTLAVTVEHSAADASLSITLKGGYSVQVTP